MTVVALVPPNEGIHATLSNSGLSRVMVGPPFEQMATIHRLPESIALSAAYKATGLFELRPDDPMLLPFEGNGVDTTWRLEMPKGANRFDYATLYDVLFTVHYTALEDRDYRTKVLDSMGQDSEGFVRTSAVRYFSLHNDFADEWYHLLNPVPGLSEDKYWNPATQAEADGKPQRPYVVALDLNLTDFVPNEERRSIKKVALAMQTADGQEGQDWCLPVQAVLGSSGGKTELRIDRFLGSLDGLSGRQPYGKWVFSFGNQCGPSQTTVAPPTVDLANELKKRVKDFWLIIEYDAAVHYNR